MDNRTVSEKLAYGIIAVCFAAVVLISCMRADAAPAGVLLSIVTFYFIYEKGE